MSRNPFIWVTEGGDLGTADWGCLTAAALACVYRLHAVAVCRYFWQVGSHRRRNHPRQILSRLIQGLGATGAQNLGFPIDFDSRPNNSVTHYTVLHCDK